MCRDISQNATSFIILLDKVPGYNLNCQLIFHISSPVPTRNSHQSDYLPICRTPKMWTKVISNQGIFNIFATFPPPFLDWFKVARSTLERFNSLQTVLVWRQLFKLHKQLPQKLHCLLDVLTFFFFDLVFTVRHQWHFDRELRRRYYPHGDCPYITSSPERPL